MINITVNINAPSDPQITQDPLEQTTPEDTTPEETVPDVTTPDVTTPDQTTSEEETTVVTTPVVTTPPETTPDEPVTTPPVETTTEPPVDPPKPDEEKIKIYIDQGHNLATEEYDSEGNPIPTWNTGAQGNGLDEAELTYEIGMLLYELLMQDGRFDVRLSRPTADTILGEYNGSVTEANNSALDFRVNDAKEWGADYFISLHINSFTSDTVTGLEVYSANGDEVGYALGEDILNSLVKATELRNRGMKDGSNLRVLKNATMPAVLVEMGFISNPNDAKLLDESPELFAQSVYDGIQAYFGALESETPEE
jgi:N-acetylmuramoyl-L-alanine amidase